MKTDTLLVEVRTEELPPPAVRVLAEKFPHELLNRLREGGLTDSKTPRNGMFATPRRFAALIDGVQERAKDRKVTRRGPQVKDGLDSAGKPSPALQGFMRAVGVTDVTQLTRETEKGREYFVWRGNKPGATLADALAQMVTDSMCAIPDFPSMTWGAHDYAFVRPVRGLVMMLGGDVIPGEVMGAKSGSETRGHPVLSQQPVQFKRAEDYADTLREANVIVDCDKRESELKKKLNAQGMQWRDDASVELMREVAVMCEKPSVYKGAVDKEFLNLPGFCVASCLSKNQKCFPLYKGESVGGFLFVSDNEPQSANNIVTGVNAVARARLNDLLFYIKEDKQLTSEQARAKLEGIVYHRKLGSQSARAKRIETIAAALGDKMDLDKEEVKSLKQAAKVCKLDLPTMMVSEYPQLAGQMAAFYFCEDKGEIAEIARYHGDGYLDSGKSNAAVALYLADKLEKIVGMFLIGEKPAGRKDPHGLRRAAAQIATVLALPGNNAKRIAEYSLVTLLYQAFSPFSGEFDAKEIDINGEVRNFIVNRIPLPGIDAAVKNAVDSRLSSSSCIAEIPKRCKALQEFLRNYRDEASSLIAANKRVNNILRKAREDKDRPNVWTLAPDSLQERAERNLRGCLVELQEKTQQLLARDDYQEMLSILATKAAAPVREFFDKIMVNDEDDKLRSNRLALLSDLQVELNKVADLEHLSAPK